MLGRSRVLAVRRSAKTVKKSGLIVRWHRFSDPIYFKRSKVVKKSRRRLGCKGQGAWGRNSSTCELINDIVPMSKSEQLHRLVPIIHFPESRYLPPHLYPEVHRNFNSAQPSSCSELKRMVPVVPMTPSPPGRSAQPQTSGGLNLIIAKCAAFRMGGPSVPVELFREVAFEAKARRDDKAFRSILDFAASSGFDESVIIGPHNRFAGRLNFTPQLPSALFRVLSITETVLPLCAAWAG